MEKKRRKWVFVSNTLAYILQVFFVSVKAFRIMICSSENSYSALLNNFSSCCNFRAALNGAKRNTPRITSGKIGQKNISMLSFVCITPGKNTSKTINKMINRQLPTRGMDIHQEFI
jgi:hypothetical protein